MPHRPALKRLRPLALAFAASAALITAAPVSGFAAGETTKSEQKAGPQVTSFFLNNGMQVVVIPDRRAPVVTHMVWYKAGSADEPAGKSGIAHYLEHLMFKGTKTTKAGEFSALIQSVGGQENAFTSTDYTAYFQRVTPELLPEMMRLEADRMENLVLDQEKILAEREVVQEERNQRTENNPGSILREAMAAALYQNHRYGIPIIGWEHEIDGLTKDDAIAFYDQFYTPNNAILVVAGDVTADTVRTLAKETYGKVKRRAEPGERMRAQEPPPRAARRITMSDARVRTPSFQRLYLVPSYRLAEGNEAEAMDIASEIIGSVSTSRLYRALVIRDKIATSAGAWYQGGSYDDTEFGFYGSPAPGKTLAEVEAATNAEIAKVLAEGVTQKEVERAQKRLIRSAVFAQDSQTTLARIYGGSLTLGSTIEKIQSWPERIQAVTVDDVNKALRKYIKIERSVTGHLTPENKEG
ncbi:MAG: pitrilysin family protein [Pseudomonadota bacterium]